MSPLFGRLTVILTGWACLSAHADDIPGPAARDAKDAALRTAPFLIAGYLPWYRTQGFTAERIQGVTDLIYFGLRPTDDGRFDAARLDQPTRELLRSLNAATGCRILVCMGGGGQSAGFPPLAADPDKRQAFVRELCAFCRAHEFDGVDYDWEHPEGAAELAAYVHLLRETKRGLGERGLVTVAQSPWRDFGREVYDVVDRVHVMSYNHRFPQATLAAARDDVKRMQDWGCPPEKLVLGVPFYGRDAAGKTRTYADLIRNRPAATAGDLLDGYAFNSAATVLAKTRLARDGGLEGIMIWELGQDASETTHSLLEVISREVK